jgi:cysteine desulfurase
MTAWRAAADQAWSDPARLHHAGRRAGMILDAARASIARALGIRPQDVFFTSSGPTAVSLAVQGLLKASGRSSGRAIASAVESMAVLSPLEHWAEQVDLIPVAATGRLDLTSLEEALSRPAALACVQAANAEVGTRQPLVEAAALARSAGVPLVVHAVQVVGHDPVPQAWDVLAASARDWGGPAGVGVLAVRPDVRWLPEETADRGWVGGFPDIPGAAAAAAGLEYLEGAVEGENQRLRDLVARLRVEVPARVAGVHVAGDPTDRLPHIVTFACEGITGEALVAELGRAGLSVASGSACTSDIRMPSHVLEAMGLAADASVRVSLPYGCSDDTVEALLSALPAAVATLRSGPATQAG